MRKNAWFNFIIRSCAAGLVSFFVLICVARAADQPSVELEQEVDQNIELAETQIAGAIQNLIELENHFQPSTAYQDRRLVVSALIKLYLSDDQRGPAKKLIVELNSLGTQYKDQTALGLALDFQALVLMDEGKLDEASTTSAQALQLAKTANSKKLTVQANHTASVVHSAMGDFNAALQYQLAGMSVLDSEDRHDDLDRIIGLSNIGTIYLDLKDPSTALEYFDKGVSIARGINAQSRLAVLILDRGVAFSDLEKYPEAIKAYLETQNLSHKLADRRGEVIAVNNLSDIYYRTGNFRQCLRYAKQTVELADRLENIEMQAFGIVNVGLCQMGLGETVSGAREVVQGIDMLRKEGAKTDIEQVYGQLAAAYEKAGMFREAYKAIVDQLTLSTELFKSDRDRAVSEMKAKYDASERQKQIEVLEQKNKVQSAEIQNKGLQRIIAILVTIIAAVIAVTIFFLYRKVRQANLSLEEANQKLAHQSTRDPLTGLFNRRAFHDAMKFRTKLSDRRVLEEDSPPHAFVMLDIDHFKRINDTYGHAAGDAVLIELSKRLAHVMRDKDMLMRWGGEEFLIFLNHIPVAKLPQVMERILIGIGGSPVRFEKNTIPATISIGYISLPLGMESEIDLNWEKMLNLADSALYMAKTRGRNQAIGLQLVDPAPEDLNALLEGNLENSILQGKVAILQIAGPVQNETVAQF